MAQSLFVLGIIWNPLNTQFVWDRGVGGTDSLEKAWVEAPVQRHFRQREDLVQASLGPGFPGHAAEPVSQPDKQEV